jgi:hypothetical protein
MTGCSWVALAVSFFAGMLFGVFSIMVGCIAGRFIREGGRLALSDEERRRIQRGECG